MRILIIGLETSTQGFQMQILATGPRIERRFIMPSGFRQDLARPGLDTAVHHWRLKYLETGPRMSLPRLEVPGNRCASTAQHILSVNLFIISQSVILIKCYSSPCLGSLCSHYLIGRCCLPTSKTGTVHRGGSKAAIGCWTASPRCISTAGW